jgi:hypothetical protein
VTCPGEDAYPPPVARTRVRRAAVDGVGYRWVIGRVDTDHVSVKVWHDAPRRGGVLEVLVAFDDPWLNCGPSITAPPGRTAEVLELNPVVPALVAKLIREALPTGWQAERNGKTRFRLTRDRERLEPPPGE